MTNVNLKTILRAFVVEKTHAHVVGTYVIEPPSSFSSFCIALHEFNRNHTTKVQPIYRNTVVMKFVGTTLLALVASTAAFAPATTGPKSSALFSAPPPPGAGAGAPPAVVRLPKSVAKRSP